MRVILLIISTETALNYIRCYRFGVLFRLFVCRSSWSCVWADTLFAKLGFERWLVRLGNVCDCCVLAYYIKLYFSLGGNSKSSPLGFILYECR